MSESTPTWTPEELKEFDELVDLNSSPHQMERISGRLKLRDFVAKHGSEKCDAMWEYLESKGASK
jgi:hypothetical protein